MLLTVLSIPGQACYYRTMATKTPLNEDVYYKKTIVYNFWKHHLQFKTSQKLFSSDDIDLGTKFLLRTIIEANYGQFHKVLDLGCGYGPIGITIKSLNDNCVLHMVDRDALAVDYSVQNVRLNGLNGVEVYGSLGYDDVKQNDFDLIMSNIPGKASESAIACFLQEAAFYLTPHGMVAVVVVDPLKELVSDILDKTPGVEIVLKRSRPGHVVYHYRFTSRPEGKRPVGSAMKRGIYQRNNTTFRFAGLEYPMLTAYGLPEFDTLSYSTEMILEALQCIRKPGIRSIVVLNPGQGHVPAILWRLLRPQNITLVDRDLLALRYSVINLSLNECPVDKINSIHRIGIGPVQGEKTDIIVIMLREEGLAADNLTIHQAASLLTTGGMMFVSASSTAITRIVDIIQKDRQLNIQARERKKGFSSLVLQHE
jgi:16S rRNA (guanine1207-N2)-methyltransferase